MRVLVATSGIDPESGGPTRSVTGLCRALARTGQDITLYVLHGHHEFVDPCGVNVVYAEDSPTCGGMPDLRLFDLVHIQGLWDFGLHRIAVRCRRLHIPYVISPRGMLDPWALSVKKWKKRLAMFLYQRGDLKHTAAFHATAEMEAANIRAQGFQQPIFVASNGVDVPKGVGDDKTFGAERHRTAIFLSRLHPGKGLLTLADAWARVKPQGWTMRVVGPDTYGHKAQVIARLEALGILDAWEFVDMVDDVRKWEEYGAADILIHPSVSENFGITIAEGLAAGLPVICTKGTPWKEVESCKCGWWVDQGIEPLATALQEALTMSSANDLRVLGQRGRALVEKKYLWSAVANQIVLGYEEVLNG